MSLAVSRGTVTYGLSIRTNPQILQFQTLFSPQEHNLMCIKCLLLQWLLFLQCVVSCWGQHGLKESWLFPLGMTSHFLVPVALLTIQTIFRSDNL